MKGKSFFALFITVILCAVMSSTSVAQSADAMNRIMPEELANMLRGGGPKPLILQVGPQRLYHAAHIKGAEYAGPASAPSGIQALRNRVHGLSHTAPIVIYCGCCPWTHCPNVAPAYAELMKLGFSNVKVLYLPNNFKADWHDKGYPTDIGE